MRGDGHKAHDGDVQRLWLRTEGERDNGTTTNADVERLYGRSI